MLRFTASRTNPPRSSRGLFPKVPSSLEKTSCPHLLGRKSRLASALITFRHEIHEGMAIRVHPEALAVLEHVLPGMIG